jgi:ABC-type glycerol-3-phosphate transport system permease component
VSGKNFTTARIDAPAVMATGLFVFMIAWNEFLFALLFLVHDRDRWTVSLGIAQLTEFSVPTTVLMAGSISITVPVVAGFFLAVDTSTGGLASKRSLQNADYRALTSPVRSRCRRGSLQCAG